VEGSFFFSVLGFLNLVLVAVVGVGGTAGGSVIVSVDLNPGGALASTMAS
jgi:hypothetical protein